MSEFERDVVIVAIPNNAEGGEHCTLVYAGELPMATAPYDTMAEVCARMAMLFNPFPAYVTGHETFGSADKAVQVATLDSPFLFTMNHCVEHFHYGQWGFRPHITQVGQLRAVGSQVWMNRIGLWYGEQRHEWVLGVNRVQQPHLRPLGHARF